MASHVPPIPTCKALLLCDQAIIEAGTGKVSLIGTFAAFLVSKIPNTTQRACAFCQLTNALGKYDIVVEVNDMELNATIAKTTPAVIEVPSRLMRANIIIPIPPLPIKHTGLFEFVLHANGELIDQQQFAVLEMTGDADEQD